MSTDITASCSWPAACVPERPGGVCRAAALAAARHNLSPPARLWVVRRAWEYAVLLYTKDPAHAQNPVRAWLTLPGKEQEEVTDHKGLVNELGSEGWEMVGPPDMLNAVFTYHASNDTWHDRAYWVEAWFYFKREVTS